MRTMLFALSLVVALVLVVLALAWRRPNALELERAVEIEAPPERIFALLADVRRWEDWQPRDGQPKPSDMRVTESQPPSRIVVAVDFDRPFVAHNVNVLTLTSTAGGTRVTWGWRGTYVFPLKVMSVFVDPAKIMGPHFEQSLAGLKRAAER